MPRHLSEHYLLPIDALLMVMNQVDYVSFHAQVTALPVTGTGPYRVALTLSYGVVVHCQIARVHGGPVLDGERALHAVQSLGDIWWKLALPEQPAPDKRPDSDGASNRWLDFVPHRVPTPVALRQLPPRVRHVLSLVDGSRNLPQIAHLLHLSLEEVFHILRHACAAGWINESPLRRFELHGRSHYNKHTA
ncbi:MAG TPA: hypothetical protein VGF67_29105 [Ktedonobacteraceae bacterium]